MKNIPEKIYLVTGDDFSDEEDLKDMDFNNLEGVSCSDIRLFKNDIEYILTDKNEDKVIVVITTHDGNISNFYYTHDVDTAEETFLTLCRNIIWNFDEYTDEDIQEILDAGYEKYGTNEIMIIHPQRIIRSE